MRLVALLRTASFIASRSRYISSSTLQRGSAISGIVAVPSAMNSVLVAMSMP